MTFLIVTHVPHIINNNQYFGYAPYIREMNIWLKHVDKVIIVAPVEKAEISPIYEKYNHQNIEFIQIKDFNILNLKSIISTFFKLPKIMIQLFGAIKKSDHIHLRCPGNVGLLGAFAQIFFPNKVKTVKYAGNWDYNSKKPFTYKLQQKILNNTFLSRNTQVLVYGKWEGTSTNIKPFFTATYSESDKTETLPRKLNNKIKFTFVGTLVSGKRPLYCIQLVEKLLEKGLNVNLSIFGEGNQRQIIQEYILNNNLAEIITIYGNKDLNTIKKHYQESHFLILPSESEGWPKVLAEAMFWGCIPISTNISCVPFMLDYGNRGILLSINLEEDTTNIQKLIDSPNLYEKMSENGQNWSRKYTLDYFEDEIKLLLQE
jgi:glycosyltransferase involved in cell wall biosynthesis